MKLRVFDSLVGWCALTIVAAMGMALLLNALFVQLGGALSKPSLEETGLLRQVAQTVRIINAAPVEQRTALTLAAAERDIQIRWAGTRSDIGMLRAHATADPPDEEEQAFRQYLRMPDANIEIYSSDDWNEDAPDRRYAIIVQLEDGSWLSFSTHQRTWGLDSWKRRLLVLGMLSVSALLVAWIAARRLSRPLLAFTEGTRRFGADFGAPAISPVGPREIRQAIAAFNRMQAQIRSFVNERTHMLAAISHDLRAPLTRLRLRGEFIEDPELQQRLFRDVDEMQAMIHAALEFIRDDARAEPATDFDLAELLRTLCEDYDDQQIPIRFIGPTRQRYHGRPLAIKRVVTNLLENALKYAGNAELQLSTAADRLQITVCDSGPGLPEADLERVFEPYVRLEISRNRATGGVGLGLSSARAIAHENGAELILRNRSEGGLEARLTLPS